MVSKNADYTFGGGGESIYSFGNPITQAVVDHPPHYGGANNPYEAIEIIEALDLGFHLGNVVKYIVRAGKKGDYLENLKKAEWYLDREIRKCEK